jgi:hypothetical protein
VICEKLILKWSKEVFGTMRDLAELGMHDSSWESIRRPPPTSAQIRHAQDTFGAKLPREYIRFLKFSNGGYPQLRNLPSSATPLTHEMEISFFFHLSDSPQEPWDIVFHFLHRWEQARSGILVPIAATDGDDTVFLDLTNPSDHRVLYSVHDPLDSPFIVLAESFEQLIDSLGPPGPDDDDQLA